MIVNTTSPKLSLNCGIISKKILASAGTQVQNECNTKYPRGINSSKVAVTSAGQISHVKFIFHITSVGFTSIDETGELLNSIIVNCLDKLDERSCTSISFPSIGTGSLNYPHDFVAKYSLNSVKTYMALNSHKKIKVNFVVYQLDTAVLQVSIVEYLAREKKCIFIVSIIYFLSSKIQVF